MPGRKGEIPGRQEQWMSPVPLLCAQEEAWWLSDPVVPSSPGRQQCPEQGELVSQGQRVAPSALPLGGGVCPSLSFGSCLWSASALSEQTSQPLLSQALIHSSNASVRCFVQLETCLGKKHSFKCGFCRFC